MTSKFSSEVRERTKWLNLLNYAADTKQARDFAEHRQTIDVQANSGMTEQLRDVEKVSCAAAEIENLLWSRQIEFKLANSADVDSDPAFEIEILWASPLPDLLLHIAGESARIRPDQLCR